MLTFPVETVPLSYRTIASDGGWLMHISGVSKWAWLRQAGRQPFPGSLSFALFCRLSEGHRYFKTEAAPILLSNGSLPAEARLSTGHNIMSPYNMCHLIPIRMVTLKKPENSKSWRVVEKLECLYTVGGNVKWYSSAGNSMVVPQKIKSRITLWSNNFTSGYIPKRTESRVLKRYLCAHIHCRSIYNSQKVGATQVPIDEWKDKQNVVCTYNGILLSLREERNSDICYSMDETWGH